MNRRGFIGSLLTLPFIFSFSRDIPAVEEVEVPAKVKHREYILEEYTWCNLHLVNARMLVNSRNKNSWRRK